MVRQDDESDDSSSDGSADPKRLPSRQKKPRKPLKGRSIPLHRGKEKTVRRKTNRKNKDIRNSGRVGGDLVKITLRRASRPRTSEKSGKREKPALVISHLCDGSEEEEAYGAGASKKGVGTVKKAASQKVGTPKKPPPNRKTIGLTSAAASNVEIGRRKTSAAISAASVRTAVENTTGQQEGSTKKYCTRRKIKRSEKRIPTVDALAPSITAAAPSGTASLLRPARRPSSSPGLRSISNPRPHLSSGKVAKRSVLTAPSKGMTAALATRRGSGSESGLIREAFVVKRGAGDARRGSSTVLGGKERRKFIEEKGDELPLLP